MKKNIEFDKVKKIINDLWDDGLIQRGSGHCVAMSDIVHKLLLHHGIESYLQECSLMIYKTNIVDLILVGYSLAEVDNSVNQVKTHVVCITKTETPILIDLSIYNFVDGVPYICEYLEPNSTVDQFEFPNGKFMYTKKYSDYQLPLLHQRSMMNRIQTDSKIFNNFKKINIILVIIFMVSLSNFIRGSFDFYQKYFVRDNGYGPTTKLFNNRRY
jgi:hypothetical protein